MLAAELADLEITLPDKDIIAKKVEEYLNDISYKVDPEYVPSDFALEFINFIKLVNGEEGEENESPVIHMHMLDQVAYGGPNIVNMCARGTAKTTLLGEYLFLYLAVYGYLKAIQQLPAFRYVRENRRVYEWFRDMSVTIVGAK